jgi:hypothetical protein
MHVTDVALRVVAGRLTGTWMDFATESLLTQTPMALSLESDPVGDFTKLRNAIAARLDNSGKPLIDQALINSLKVKTIASADLPGVKGYKCGWMNMVLFATLDLLRCVALYDLPCDRTSTRNGVVLGWAHQKGGTWVFDCSYRHAWEPPRGFTEAFLGGTCTDPCALYRTEVESLIANYAPPDPPPAGGGGTPPVVDYCEHLHLKLKECVVVHVPPKKIPDHWQKWWVDPPKDPKIPVWNPPEFSDPVDIYEYEGVDQLLDGFIHAGGVLGYPVDKATDVLTKTAKNAGVTANVVIKQAGDLAKTPGYAPSEGFSPSDTMVLTVGADQKTVIGVGRISVLQTSRQVGTVLPAAVDAADRAVKAADGIQTTVTEFGTKVGAFDTQLKTFGEGLATLSGEFTAYSGGKFDQPSFETRLRTLERSVKNVGDLGDRLSKVEGGMGVLTHAGLGKGVVNGFEPGFARGISEFASATVEAMKSLGQVDNANFRRYTTTAERAQAGLDAAIEANDPGAVTTATLGVLSTLRTLVKASGVDVDLGRKLDAQVRAIEGLIG